jgi:hypothetical protein
MANYPKFPLNRPSTAEELHASLTIWANELTRELDTENLRQSSTPSTKIYTVVTITDIGRPEQGDVAYAISVGKFKGYTTTATEWVDFQTSTSSVESQISSVSVNVAELSATMATSIANHLRLTGGQLTGTLSATNIAATNITASTSIRSSVSAGDIGDMLGSKIRLYKDVNSGNSGNIVFEEGSGQNVALSHNVFDGELPQAGTALLLQSLLDVATHPAHFVADGEIFADAAGTPTSAKKVWHAGNLSPYTFSAVGSYMFAFGGDTSNPSSRDYVSTSPGSTMAGSKLIPIGIGSNTYNGGNANTGTSHNIGGMTLHADNISFLSGTWRCMGDGRQVSSTGGVACLWVRIS